MDAWYMYEEVSLCKNLIMKNVEYFFLIDTLP